MLFYISTIRHPSTIREYTIGRFTNTNDCERQLVVSNEDEVRLIDTSTLSRAIDIRGLSTYEKPFGYATDLILGVTAEQIEGLHLIIMNITGNILSFGLKSPKAGHLSAPRITVSPLHSGHIVYYDALGSIEILMINKQMIDSLMHSSLKKRQKLEPAESVLYPLPSGTIKELQFSQDESLIGLFRDQTDTVLRRLPLEFKRNGVYPGKWEHIIRGNITCFVCVKGSIIYVDYEKVLLLPSVHSSLQKYSVGPWLELEAGEIIEHACNFSEHETIFVSTKGIAYLAYHDLSEVDKEGGPATRLTRLGPTTIPHKVSYLGDRTFHIHSQASYLMIFKVNELKPYISVLKTFEEPKPIMDINAIPKTMTQDIIVCQGGYFSGELIRYPACKNKLSTEECYEDEKLNMTTTNVKASIRSNRQLSKNDVVLAKKYATCGRRSKIPKDIENKIMNEDLVDTTVIKWDCIRSKSRWIATRVLLSLVVEIWFVDSTEPKISIQLDSFAFPSACYITANIEKENLYYVLILFTDGTFTTITRPFDEPTMDHLTTDKGSILNMVEVSWGLYLMYDESDVWMFKAWKGQVERCFLNKPWGIHSITRQGDLAVEVEFENEQSEKLHIVTGIEEYVRLYSNAYYVKSIVVNNYIIVLSHKLTDEDEKTYHLLAVDSSTFKVIDTVDFESNNVPIDLIKLHPETTIRNKISSLPYLLEEVTVSNKFIVAFKSLPVALLYSVESDGIKVERQQGWQYESTKREQGKQLLILSFVQLNPKEASFMAVGNVNFIMQLKHNELFYWSYYTNMRCTLPSMVTMVSPLEDCVIVTDLLNSIYKISLPRSIYDHDFIDSSTSLEHSKRSETELKHKRLFASPLDFITALNTRGSQTIIFGDTGGNLTVGIGSKYYTHKICGDMITALALLPVQQQYGDTTNDVIPVLVGSVRGGLYLVFFDEKGQLHSEHPVIMSYMKSIA